MNGSQTWKLELYPDTVEVVRKEINLENPGRVEEAVNILEQWVQKQNHFMKKDIPRIYLETTLISMKGSVERAKQKLDKLCTLKSLMPEYFPMNITKETFRSLDGMTLQTHLPKLTKEHNRVFLVKVLPQNQDQINSNMIQTFIKYTMMTCEYLRKHDYHGGLVGVFDYREINIINYLTKINVMDIKNFATLVTEGYSFRIRGIHIISDSKMVDSLVSLIKQVISSKLGDRITLHKKPDTLYEVIGKDILPEDYGGKEKLLKELSDEELDLLCSEINLKFIHEMFQAKTDEKRRPADMFNEHYIGIPGSFRALSVD